MGDITMSPPSIDAVSSHATAVSARIMVIAMIVLFFVVAFLFFLSVYAKWYWSRNEDPFVASWRRRAATPAVAAAKRRGLDRATLRSLPLVVYDPKDFKEGLECSVCLSEISEGEKVRLLPKCNHGFHVECIDMWFKSHSTCPLCRNSVLVSTQIQTSNNSPSNEEVSHSESDSDSDSDSSDDEIHDHEHASAVQSGEALAFPTNILFWGNGVQVRSLGEGTNAAAAAATASASASASDSQRDELVIEIPRELCDECFSSPASTFGEVEEEAKTPVVSRLRSLRRLLSRGKRVAPSTSADVEPV